ncbi:MAG: D-aminoacyl-tRNA deacylase [Acidimicrobiia bacterium]
MRIVLQRVSSASVRVDGQMAGAIGPGLLALVGIEPSDTVDDLAQASMKVANLLVFPDDQGLMNRSLLDIGGSALVVSQFTLLGDVRKGRRPSFAGAAPPEMASVLFDRFVAALRGLGIETATGVFGAAMEVELVNDGPVTIVLDVSEGRVT